MKKTFQKQSITAELAEMMINAAVKKSIEINKPMVIAILDESGHLKSFQRMDGAALISIGVAQDKAYSALANAWGHATHVLGLPFAVCFDSSIEFFLILFKLLLI